MIYTITIVNATPAPIPGAAVTFSRSGQQLLSRGTNSAGQVQIDSDTDSGLLQADVDIVFSAPGFYNYGISGNNLPQLFTVTLEKKTDTTKVLGIGAAAAVALLAMSGGKKGLIGSVEKESRKSGLPGWALPAAALGVGGLLLYNFFTKKDPKESDSAALLPAVDQKLQQLAGSGQVPTISAATAQSLSSAIVEATDDCGTDEQAIFNAFAQLQNEADFYYLMKTFGVRQIHSCFSGNWFGNTPYNLPQIITAELSSGDRATLNNILQQIGINYQF